MKNILFIQTDQLSIKVLGFYGHSVAVTPNLDRLAEGGLVFGNAYCNYPLCAPSRFSMASGLLASKIGAFDNACEFPAAIPTYAHYLRALGYRTCLSGKMHFVGPDQLHGFERRLTTDIYPGDFSWTADWSKDGFEGATDIRMLTESGISARNVQIDYDEDVTHKAVQEIYDSARSDDTRPFFLQVSYTHPHDPYLCLQKHWDLYEDVAIPDPAVGEIGDNENDPHSLRVREQHGLRGADIPPELIRRARRAYCGSVSYIDDNIGKLLEALRGSGQDKDTIIVFCSDHGEMLGERGLWLKKTFFEPAMRVPLLIHAPGEIAPGRSEALCSLVDLLPSFAALASEGKWAGPVEPLDGTDITALPRSGYGARPVHAELLCEGVLAPIFMQRAGRWKAITSEGDPPLLYDIEADPDERVNLAGDPSHAARLERFRAEASALWDTAALSREIVLSQRRRLLIRRAHAQGVPPVWDFDAGQDDSRFYRGHGNYNDWAFAHLAVTPES